MTWPTRHNGLPRERYIPFRVLAMLMYGQHYATAGSGYMEYLPESNELIIHSLAKLAKSLRMRSTNLRDALGWLHKSGYLTELQYITGGAAARMSILPPYNTRRAQSDGR
jgi:hypothetical protein